MVNIIQLAMWHISPKPSFTLKEIESVKWKIIERELRYPGLQLILEQECPDTQIFPDELFLKKEHSTIA